MNQSEVKRIESDAAWWRQLESIGMWSLIGFTYRNGATFSTSPNQTLQLTGSQAQDILDFIKEVRNA